MIIIIIYEALQKTEMQETSEHRLLGTGIPCTRSVSYTVYLTHESTRVKQEEAADIRILVIQKYEIWKKGKLAL